MKAGILDLDPFLGRPSPGARSHPAEAFGQKCGCDPVQCTESLDLLQRLAVVDLPNPEFPILTAREDPWPVFGNRCSIEGVSGSPE
jgi:hypothetical protein